MKSSKLVISLAIVALIMVAVVPMAGAIAPESARTVKFSVDKDKLPPPVLICRDGFWICPENADGDSDCTCGKFSFVSPAFESAR